MNAKHIFACSIAVVLALPLGSSAQSHDASVGNHELHFFAAADFGIDPATVTFTKDIAPILQRSCQNCHRDGGGAPMALQTYQSLLSMSITSRSSSLGTPLSSKSSSTFPG